MTVPLNLANKETFGMKFIVTERRLDGKIRLMRVGAIICAAFAAVGIGLGIHEASPDSGWVVPVLAGGAAASALAIFWHISIGACAGVVRRLSIVAMFVLATAVTAISLGASAQAIATAVAGRAALSAELSLRINAFNQALAEAFAEATGWGSVASSAAAKAAGYKLQAETEMGGGNGYGKGCGPRCSSLRDISDAFSNSQAALNGLLDDAAELRKGGEASMATLRDAATRGDQTSFMAAAEGVAQAIARMNAIDPKPIIVNTGAVVVSKKGIDLSQETKDFYASAEKALADRKTVDSPVFTPMSLGEATRSQVLGSALHGWILAGCIDVMPLLLLILAFALSREVWMHEPVSREKLSSEDKDDADRRRLSSLQGNTVPFKQAAE